MKSKVVGGNSVSAHCLTSDFARVTHFVRIASDSIDGVGDKEVELDRFSRRLGVKFDPYVLNHGDWSENGLQLKF